MKKKMFIILFLALTAAIGTGVCLLALHKQTTLQETPSLETVNYQIFVEQLENDALRELQKLNITKEKLEKACQQYKPDFDKAAEIKKIDEVSSSIKSLVIESLNEFKINPDTIKIASFDHPAPAESCQGVIFINEQRFLRHSLEAQYFMIGHEIQHLLTQDSLKDFAIDKLIQDSNNPEKSQILSNYSKIIEQIADNRTALTSPKWAQRYLQFMEESVSQDGNQVKSIHPQHTERLKVAQSIVTQMNKQIA